MPPLPPQRHGTTVLIRKRPLQFSYWPMYRSTRRYGLQSVLFALDPWVIIRQSIATRCPKPAQPEALAYLRQARDFHNAATLADVTAARPLLLYYCFMNLVKAYILTVEQRPALPQAMHGLSERLPATGKELIDAYLEAYQSPAQNGDLNIFDEFLCAIGATPLSAQTRYHLLSLMPQVLPSHRVWAGAATKTERFISVHDLFFCENRDAKEVWLSLYLYADDLARLGVAHQALLAESMLDDSFREVRLPSDVKAVGGRKLICFEQTTPLNYTHRAADEIAQLAASTKHALWTIVSTMSPYRRYYLYPAPVMEHAEVLPQLASAYAVMYYLGSITRYRPHHLSSILEGRYGAFIEEFISSQPLQFIYLMASEFARREVTRPAIV